MISGSAVGESDGFGDKPRDVACGNSATLSSAVCVGVTVQCSIPQRSLHMGTPTLKHGSYANVFTLGSACAPLGSTPKMRSVVFWLRRQLATTSRKSSRLDRQQSSRRVLYVQLCSCVLQVSMTARASAVYSSRHNMHQSFIKAPASERALRARSHSQSRTTHRDGPSGLPFSPQQQLTGS